jgi:proteasome lid subunit RPN8/RPN11
VTRDRPIAIRSAVRAAILAHARRERPLECCGLLLGSAGRIEFAVPMANASRSRTRYSIHPRAHIELRRLVRGFVPSLAIVGVYHSHPRGGSTPSPTDVAEALYPDWTHLIVGLGLRRPRIRAFRITRGTARQMPIRWRPMSAGVS